MDSSFARLMSQSFRRRGRRLEQLRDACVDGVEDTDINKTIRVKVPEAF